MSLQHIKVVIPEPEEDGSIRFTTESYYEQLAHRTVEVEKKLSTDRQRILKDLISCLEVLSTSNRLVLTIDGFEGKPVQITKRYLVSRENFKRMKGSE